MSKVAFGKVASINCDWIAPDWPHIRRHRERREMRVIIDGVDAGAVREDNGGKLECDAELAEHFEFGLGADSIGWPDNFPAAKRLIREAVEKTA